MAIGRRIQVLFRERGIKQYVVARDAGVTPTKLSRMLTGKEPMTLPVFLQCMKVLDERPSAFLGEEGALSAELLQQLRGMPDQMREYARVIEAIVDPQPEVPQPKVSEESRLVPLVRVAATADNRTYNDDEARLYALPPEYSKADTRAFEVVGDSMIGDGIVSGDIVFTRPPRNKPDSDGNICVCRVDGDHHLKRVRYHRTSVQLVSSTPEPAVWELPADPQRVKIVGIVIGRTGRIAR